MSDEDDFAPIWDESILLAEHKAVYASVKIGGWLSAALDDPNVCEAMKADINHWFDAGFLYLNDVRKVMQADRAAYCAALREEVERLRKELARATKFIGAQKHTKRGYEASTRATAALNGGKYD